MAAKPPKVDIAVKDRKHVLIRVSGVFSKAQAARLVADILAALGGLK